MFLSPKVKTVAGIINKAFKVALIKTETKKSQGGEWQNSSLGLMVTLSFGLWWSALVFIFYQLEVIKQMYHIHNQNKIIGY